MLGLTVEINKPHSFAFVTRIEPKGKMLFNFTYHKRLDFLKGIKGIVRKSVKQHFSQNDIFPIKIYNSGADSSLEG